MPATTYPTGSTPRRSRAFHLAAAAVGVAVLALAGFAAADQERASGVKWQSAEGLAGVESYRLDFLGASGLAPLSAPLRPATRTRGFQPIVVAPLETARAPEGPASGDPDIRPVATNPLGATDEPADSDVGGRSYSLSDAVRDADWRKATARRLRSLTPSHTAF
jgi:hypothetical protein